EYAETQDDKGPFSAYSAYSAVALFPRWFWLRQVVISAFGFPSDFGLRISDFPWPSDFAAAAFSCLRAARGVFYASWAATENQTLKPFYDQAACPVLLNLRPR
ncbi:MAG: hypothetical protein ABSH34_27300, partial [Verrucomicrobiota bacterium]